MGNKFANYNFIFTSPCITISPGANEFNFFLSYRQPRFHNWGFNLDRGADSLKKWDQIPEGIDILITHGPPIGKFDNYRKTSNISRILLSNKIVDHSDVVGAAPVVAAPTTSSFST